MDDYSIDTIIRGKNLTCAVLVDYLTEPIKKGILSIYDESIKLCDESDESEKYLMTFQTFLSRIPKWNPNIIENEKNRIIEHSSCNHLEDLVTCVHIAQLKALSSIRVGTKQKKIDINIPSLDKFIHNIYINIARKIYKNIYLYEKNIPPLQKQKNNREIEIIITECILFSIRESIPIEHLLKAFISSTEEEEIITTKQKIDDKKHVDDNKKHVDDDKDQDVNKPDDNKPVNDDNKPVNDDNKPVNYDNKPVNDDNKPRDDNKSVDDNNKPIRDDNKSVKDDDNKSLDSDNNSVDNVIKLQVNDSDKKDIAPTKIDNNTEQTLTFSNLDNELTSTGKENIVRKPKTIERLDEIEKENLIKEQNERENDDDDDDDKIKIGELINEPLNNSNNSLNIESINLDIEEL